jgi:hypothetical protein
MFVYVISAGPQRQKIGISKNVAGRLAQLQTGHHSGLEVEAMVECRDERAALEVESLAHRLLGAKRLRGEWFLTSPQEAIGAVASAIAVITGEVEMPSLPAVLVSGPLVRREPAIALGSHMSMDTVTGAHQRREVNAELYRRLVAPGPRETGEEG